MARSVLRRALDKRKLEVLQQQVHQLADIAEAEIQIEVSGEMRKVQQSLRDINSPMTRSAKQSCLRNASKRVNFSDFVTGYLEHHTLSIINYIPINEFLGPGSGSQVTQRTLLGKVPVPRNYCSFTGSADVERLYYLRL